MCIERLCPQRRLRARRVLSVLFFTIEYEPLFNALTR